MHIGRLARTFTAHLYKVWMKMKGFIPLALMCLALLDTSSRAFIESLRNKILCTY